MKIGLRQTVLTYCFLSLLVPQVLLGQTQLKPPAKPFELTVDSIMRGPRLVGYPPSGVYWSQDSQRVYFRWKQADEPRLKEMSLYVVNRDGRGLRRLTDEEAKQAPPANGELSKDKTKTVFSTKATSSSTTTQRMRGGKSPKLQTPKQIRISRSIKSVSISRDRIIST